jgi:hypothetical protein
MEGMDNNGSSSAALNGVDSQTFVSSNGGSASINQVNGKYEITVTDKSGNTTTYSYNPSDPASSVEGNTFYGPFGGQARLINNDNSYLIRIFYPNGGSIDYTTSKEQYANYPAPSSSGDAAFQGGGEYPSTSTSANVFSGGTSPTDYSSTLPTGIPRNMIPPGQENLYILKSQVVPPVCPACPAYNPPSSSSQQQQQCPPCPACARCPEPSFECKKVPNYNAINNNSNLPVPVLSDFSSFAM